MAAPDEVSSDAAVASVISELESRVNNGSEGFSQWEKMFSLFSPLLMDLPTGSAGSALLLCI